MLSGHEEATRDRARGGDWGTGTGFGVRRGSRVRDVMGADSTHIPDLASPLSPSIQSHEAINSAPASQESHMWEPNHLAPRALTPPSNHPPLLPPLGPQETGLHPAPPLHHPPKKRKGRASIPGISGERITSIPRPEIPEQNRNQSARLSAKFIKQRLN